MGELLISYTPLHSCFGLFEELPESPDPIILKWQISKGEILHTNHFKVDIINIKHEEVELLIFENKGVHHQNKDFSSEFKVTIKSKASKRFFVTMCDALEWYDISYIYKSE